MTKEKLTIKLHNVETGEIIERDLTAEEIAQIELDVAKEEARLAEAQAKAAQRQAILDKLGLTADEARLLLG